MTSFDVAVNELIELEGNGKVANDPNDPGGLTKWGISQRSYPDLDIANLTRDDAIAIYKRDWWLPVYDEINSQEIATKVFCNAVNMGRYIAHVHLQRACNVVDNTHLLLLDGYIGDHTLYVVNHCDPDVLLKTYENDIIKYYKSLNNPAEIKGWINRENA